MTLCTRLAFSFVFLAVSSLFVPDMGSVFASEAVYTFEDSEKKDADKKEEGDSEKKDADKKEEGDSEKKDAEKKEEGDSEKKDADKKEEGDSEKKDADKKEEGDSEKKDADKKEEGDSEKKDADKKEEGDSEKKDADKKEDGDSEKKDADKKEEGDSEKKDAEKKEKGDPKKETEKKAEEKKPETIELDFEPLRLTLKVSGTFEAREPKTVRLKGKEFTAFELKEVLSHGQTVRKGEILARFDEKKYDETFQDRKRALRLSEISLREEELSFTALERKQPLRRESFEKSKKENDEDFAYALNVEIPQDKESIAFSKEMMDFQVENAREELRQLEKMYRDEDLREETEEIVLRRARFELKYYEFMAKMRNAFMDRNLDTYLPRMEDRMRRGAQMEEIEYQRTRDTIEHAVEQAKLRLEKTRETHAKLVESFGKFQKDKDLLVLRAPADGVLYYGDYVKGKWSGGAQVDGMLKVGETVRNDTVLFSIVEPRPSLLRVTVPEKDLDSVKVGTTGQVTPTAFPDVRYKVRVTEVNDYPGPANDFTAMLKPELPKNNRLTPGMNGSAELVVYNKKNAVMVPTSALEKKEEEDDSWNHAYAYVYRDTGATDRVKVALGKVKGDKTEILSGLSKGMKILKTPPKDDDKKKDEKKKDDKK